MTIVIPEDKDVNEIVIDVRDGLNSKIYNDFANELVFTIQKSEFQFNLNDKSFVDHMKDLLKGNRKEVKIKILNILEDKYEKIVKRYIANFNVKQSDKRKKRLQRGF